MDDVEKLKKIAKLSQEMRKHGFATHSDEAVQAAQAIYNGNIANELTPEQKHQALQEKKTMAGTQPELETFSKQVNQRLGDIENNLSTVISKMNEIIKEINELQKSGGRQGAAPREKEVQAALPRQEAKPAPAEPHARSGSYTPQDVQIDKIFYFGNKKSN